MATITIKQTDTARTISDTLTIDGVAINLTGATVKLAIRNKLQSQGVLRDATIVGDATDGQVSYQLVDADVETAGEFWIEWQITLASGKKIIAPSEGHHTLNITERLATT